MKLWFAALQPNYLVKHPARSLKYHFGVLMTKWPCHSAAFIAVKGIISLSE